MTGFDADVAVVGLGAWGSSALWRLAERGVNAIGFDSQTVPNPYGSSHGHTRLFRVACHEHVGLTNVARRARDLWYELGAAENVDLLHQTGLLSIGPEEGRAIKITSEVTERESLPVKRLSIDDVRRRYPQHAGLGDHYVGLLDQEAGYVRVEEAITAAVTRARSLGARVHDGVRVERVQDDGLGVKITTADATFNVRQVILSAGPWMSVLQDTVPLIAYRAPMLWWNAKEDTDAFTLERFPAFIRHYDDQHTIWGHGSTDTTPVKLGLSEDVRSKLAVHPDRLARAMSPTQDWGAVVDVMRWAVPGLEPNPVSAAPCMITESPDRQFLVGREPGRERVILAGGCSGHGFKHASAVGEILAQIATDEPVFTDTDFMNPARFTR